MLGISWAEFILILVISMLIVPANNWPDLIKFFAKTFKFIRNIIWKILDISEQIKERIELEKPIDELISKSTDELLDNFSTKIPKKTKKK